MEWRRDSWRKCPIFQQPEYTDGKIDPILDELRNSEGIVDIESVYDVLKQLKSVWESNHLVFLQAGDCAETFESCFENRILTDSMLFSQLSQFLSPSPFAPPGFVLGRICGQFAKPRSCFLDNNIDLGPIPSYRGDIVNSLDPLGRDPNPARLKIAYSLSKTCFNYIPKNQNIFISHECLLLPYEEALIRTSPTSCCSFASSAHMLWIGNRTRQIDGAHIEFCRGLLNPIGIKVGPESNPSEIRRCVELINPLNIPGKVSVITRYGVGGVEKHLSLLIDNLKGLNVLYQCDPMHGNTFLLGDLKTRHVDTVKEEIRQTVSTHSKNRSRIHGLHLEITGDNVTECVGVNVLPNEVSLRYRTACDPRLNPEQAKEVVLFTRSLLDTRCNSDVIFSSRETSQGSSIQSIPFSDEDSS